MYTGSGLPRLFEHIFMCAADMDETAFEQGLPLGELHRLARTVKVCHNRGDRALYVSDYSTGNPEHLGTLGAAHPGLLHNKIHQVDRALNVRGLVVHGYYLWGPVASDLHVSIDGPAQDASSRGCERSDTLANVWQITESTIGDAPGARGAGP
jgi:esterase/lipase superfamily enzyme